jgi:hypothetical protein
MTTANIPDLVARLREKLSALGDGRDCRSDNEKATWWAACTEAQRTLSGLMNAPADLAREQTELDAIDARRTAVLAKQAELERAIADAPDWRSFADGRERDREWDRQQNLQKQLKLLREGRLFLAPGVTNEPIGYLNQRLAELTVRRDRARAALDGYLKTAEALLAEPVTTEAASVMT